MQAKMEEAHQGEQPGFSDNNAASMPTFEIAISQDGNGQNLCFGFGADSARIPFGHPGLPERTQAHKPGSTRKTHEIGPA